MTAALLARVELGWGAFFVKRAPQKTLHVLRLVEVVFVAALRNFSDWIVDKAVFVLNWLMRVSKFPLLLWRASLRLIVEEVLVLVACFWRPLRL